jgi:hypothetical protein
MVLSFEADSSLGRVFASGNRTIKLLGLLDCLWVLGSMVTLKVFVVSKSNTAMVTLEWRKVLFHMLTKYNQHL